MKTSNKRIIIELGFKWIAKQTPLNIALLLSSIVSLMCVMGAMQLEDEGIHQDELKMAAIFIWFFVSAAFFAKTIK